MEQFQLGPIVGRLQVALVKWWEAVKMDCCKTKNKEGCCKDLENESFFRFMKKKSDKKIKEV